jgi:hypothetical protein
MLPSLAKAEVRYETRQGSKRHLQGILDRIDYLEWLCIDSLVRAARGSFWARSRMLASGLSTTTGQRSVLLSFRRGSLPISTY